MIGAVGKALVAQGIEHRFPKPNCGATRVTRKTSKFLTTTRKCLRIDTVTGSGIHPSFPIIPSNFCAEVVLGISKDVSTTVIGTYALAKLRHPGCSDELTFSQLPAEHFPRLVRVPEICAATAAAEGGRQLTRASRTMK